MYRLKPEDYTRNRFIGLWGLLAFQAGFINSIGFLAFQRFVSHVTGFGSQVGVSLGQGQFATALELFSAPITFMIGAWFSGLLTVARSSRGLRPRFDLVTLTIPLIILILMICGVNGVFGTFGASMTFRNDVILLTALTFLCGLQNGCFATLTKGQIRTTHLTGISTDIGTDFALAFNGNLEPEEKKKALRRNLNRIITVASFSTGALISAVIDTTLLYWSFLIPLVTSLAVTGVFFLVQFEIDAANPQPASTPTNSSENRQENSSQDNTGGAKTQLA